MTPAPGQPISRSPGCLPGNSPDANDTATHSSRTDALHLAACLTLQRSPYVTAMGKEARGQQSQGQSPCSRVPAERRSRVTNCTHTLQALHTTHSSLSFPPRRFLSLCHLAPPSIPKPRTGWSAKTMVSKCLAPTYKTEVRKNLTFSFKWAATKLLHHKNPSFQNLEDFESRQDDFSLMPCLMFWEIEENEDFGLLWVWLPKHCTVCQL